MFTTSSIQTGTPVHLLVLIIPCLFKLPNHKTTLLVAPIEVNCLWHLGWAKRHRFGPLDCECRIVVLECELDRERNMGVEYRTLFALQD